MISLNSKVNFEDEEVVEEIDTEDIASSEPPNDQILIQAEKVQTRHLQKLLHPVILGKSNLRLNLESVICTTSFTKLNPMIPLIVHHL